MDRVIRNDSAGGGAYLASRGNRPHKGVDYLATPGESFRSLITGKVDRITRVYAEDDRYTCLVVQGEHVCLKMFYIDPAVKVGDLIKRGEVCGTVQDVTKKYPGQGMQAHVHLEVDHMNIELLRKILAIEEIVS